MTQDEIIEKLNEKKRAMNWTNKDIAKRSGLSLNMVQRALAGENISFYKFMDLLYGMGIEVRVV